MTRRIRFAPALAILALAALPPASALALETPVLSTPAASPSYTNVDPVLGWADIDELTYDVLRDTAPCGPASGATLVDVLPQNSTSWTDLTAAPGNTYCYWVRGVDGGGPGTESNRKVVFYDTVLPTGTVTAPAASTSVRQTVAVTSADALDAFAGVSTVTFQRSPATQNTWSLIGLDNSATGGWAFDWDTSAVSDGVYDLRAVIADAAGNVANTATVANVRVDNTAPAATHVSPAAGVQLTGQSVALAATASDGGSGLASVRFEHAPAGTSSWTTTGAGAFSAGTWATTWDTTLLADGLYDLRTVAVDVAGNEAPSATIAGVRIDNTPPSAPGFPTATAQATNAEVMLVWPASPSSDIVGYRVYRDGSGTPLNASLLTGTTYTDTTLALDGSADGAHTYTLRAEDLTQLSPASNSVSVTLDTVTPAAPSVTATPQTSGAINLSWSTPSDRPAASGATGTIAGVVVRRSAAGGSTPASATDGISVCTPGSARSCSDTDTVRGATYAYAVFVRDEAGNSSRGTTSAKASDAEPTPDPTPGPKKPAAPVNVRTKVDHLGRTMLLWKLPADKTVVRIVVVRGTAKHKPRSPVDGKKLYSGTGTSVAVPLAPSAATWVAVFALNKAGVASVAVTKRIAIGAISPGEGAKLDGAVKLDWLKVPKADYYNVQIFRNGKRVLIDWPRGSKLSLANGKLANGDYTAYVWPGYGELSQARFGKLIGSASFSYRR